MANLTKTFKNLHAGAKPRAWIHVLFTFVFPLFPKKCNDNKGRFNQCVDLNPINHCAFFFHWFYLIKCLKCWQHVKTDKNIYSFLPLPAIRRLFLFAREFFPPPKKNIAWSQVARDWVTNLNFNIINKHSCNKPHIVCSNYDRRKNVCKNGIVYRLSSRIYRLRFSTAVFKWFSGVRGLAATQATSAETFIRKTKHKS